MANSPESSELWTPGAVAHALACQHPEDPAVYFIAIDGDTQIINRRQLDDWSSRLAHCLAEYGLSSQDKLAIHLPNCVEHIVSTLAAYKLGACPTPINARLPEQERDGLLALAQAKLIVSDAPDLNGISRLMMSQLSHYPSTPPTFAVPQPAKAIASGGSTGKPKLIVSPGAFEYPWQEHPLGSILDFCADDLVYSPGPLFHNQAFFFSQIALFQGAAIALNEKFDANTSLDFIETHQPQILNVVPTMMQRMLRTDTFPQRNLSSIRRMWHLAAPCPSWAKEAWIDALGAEKVWELWAATEITGLTTISGTDWQQRPGSVGQGVLTEFIILDENRKPCPTGTVGEIYSRFGDGSPQYAYLGAPALPEYGDGFRSVGDLGHIDQEGFLYLADRRTDLIISGGSNIYPAEIEAVLSSHPAIRDAAVIGLPDDDLGRRVHAVLEAQGEALDEHQLYEHCSQQLARYKVPRSFEYVDALPRNEAGKIRRSALMPQSTD